MQRVKCSLPTIQLDQNLLEVELYILMVKDYIFQITLYFMSRRMAENGFAPPPLGNFADISYLVENRKPSLLKDVCTLCSGALVCKRL